MSISTMVNKQSAHQQSMLAGYVQAMHYNPNPALLDKHWYKKQQSQVHRRLQTSLLKIGENSTKANGLFWIISSYLN